MLNLHSSINMSCPVVLFQSAELAEYTSRIALLEEAKRHKEQEANSWQLKVRANCNVQHSEGCSFRASAHNFES